MSNHNSISEIYSGIILQNYKIAEHTYHIKIHSADFSKMKYVAGFTADVFLSNPYDNLQNEVRKYSFWNYEPVFQVADFAINTFSNGKGAEWVKSLRKDDIVFFKKPSGELVIDDSADRYFLIGDITALSQLYEINRALAISKEIDSLIYTKTKSDIFPDLDHSFPLKTFVVNHLKPDSILELIEIHFQKHSKNTIAYILGNSQTNNMIYNYLKDNPVFNIKKVYIKNFWDKKIQ